MDQFKIVGKRLPKYNARSIVTGEARYAHDVVLPRMIYGKIVRSPYAHAIIVEIDTSKAKRLKGVKAVITAEDTLKIPYVNLGPPFDEKYPLCIDRARYVGDEIAAVAATSREIAEEAVALIRVTYEELPAVFDPEKALLEDAPLIYDHAANNIAARSVRQFGDVEKGFVESDHIFEDRYTTQGVAHACMEPRSTVAAFDLRGNLEVWSSTQSPYFVRKELSHILNMPISKVHIREVAVGGGFGARSKICEDEGIAAYLALQSKLPVKITLDREEEFTTTRIRHPMIINLKTGVSNDGKIMARECRVITDNGAYSQMGPAVTGYAGAILASLYRVENIRFEGLVVYTNKHYGGPFRGYGNPQMTFAIESQMDTIAEHLGIDPLELRLRNANQTGDTTPCGWFIQGSAFEECLKKAASAVGWDEREKRRSTKRGVGLGSLIHCSGAYVYKDGDFSSAEVRILGDGRVQVLTSIADIGQWVTTSLSQIAAETIGVDISSVDVISMDTELTPLDMGSWGSRGVFICGNAVLHAAEDAKNTLLEKAANVFETKQSDLVLEGGQVYVKGSPGRSMTIGEIVLSRTGRSIGKVITGKAYFEPPTELIDRATGYGNISAAYTFATQAAEVEINEETGEIKIIKIAAAHDVGKAINPIAVENQIEGSVIMGIGFGTLEEYHYENGKIVNPDFTDYRIPTIVDTPEIIPIVIEAGDPHGPFGAKAIGEAALVPTAAAIANAVYDAVGVRIKSLPISKEKLYRAILDKKGQGENLG